MFTLLTTPTGEAKRVSSLTKFAAWISQERKRLTVTGLLIGLVACPAVALWTIPVAAHPGHAGAAPLDCAHVHPGPPGTVSRFCTYLGLPGGVCRTPAGIFGTCVQKTTRLSTGQQGPAPTECECVTPPAQRQKAALSTTKDNVTLIANARSVNNVFGKDAVCAQVTALMTEVMEVVDQLAAEMPVEYYEAADLGAIDNIGANWRKAEATARSCGMTVPGGQILAVLQNVKQQLVANSFLQTGPTNTCNLDDWSGLDSFTCSATTPGCSISSFSGQVDTTNCQVNVSSFGNNSTVVFTPTSNPGEVEASGLEIMGQPNHNCTLTASANGTTTVAGGCADTTNSCTHEFVCF